MWKAVEAAGIVALSIVVTFAVVSVIMPVHHANEDRSGAVSWVLQPAVLVGTVDVRPVYAVTEGSGPEVATGASAVCPYAGRSATETVCPVLATRPAACPGLDALAVASRCPFLAERNARAECPYLNRFGGSDSPPSSCPRSGGDLGDGFAPVDGTPEHPVLAANGLEPDKASELS